MKKISSYIFLVPILFVLAGCDFTKKEPDPKAAKKTDAKAEAAKKAEADKKAAAAPVVAPATAPAAATAPAKVETPAAPAATSIDLTSNLTAREQELQRAGGGIIIRLTELDAGNMLSKNGIQIAAYFAVAKRDVDTQATKGIFQIKPILPSSGHMKLDYDSVSTNEDMMSISDKPTGKPSDVKLQVPAYLIITAGYRDTSVGPAPAGNINYIGTAWLNLNDLLNGTLSDSDRSMIRNIIETPQRIEYVFQLKDYGDPNQAGTMASVQGSVIVIKPKVTAQK